MKKDINIAEQTGKQKLVKNVFNVTLVILLVFSCVCYAFFMFQRTNEQYNIRLEETGREVAKNINSQMNLAVIFVEGMAEAFSNYEDIHCEEAIETLIRVSDKSRFERMWLTKADGSAISSELKESDANGRGYLERAKNGESGISEVQTSRVNGEKNVVIFAPTYYDGEVTGMVIGIFKLDTLLDVIDVQCFGGEGYCNIYNDKGEALVSSANQSRNVGLQSKYSYSTNAGVLDWNVYVSFPDEVISDEIRTNIIITVVMCLICVAVLGMIIVNIFRERNQLLTEKAQQDSLTMLMNRGTIEKIVDEKLANKGVYDSAFIIFDVDKFKLVNDSVGHVSGDALLKTVANLMREHFNEAACLSRLGGDEFAIFIDEVNDKEKLIDEINIFKKKVKKIPIEDGQNSTISIGIVFTNDVNDAFDSLYKKADKAMYESKRRGGNVASIYEDRSK